MLNTFQNADRHHLRRTEREQHLKAIEAIIANPGNIEEMENLTPAVADSLVGEPLTSIQEYHNRTSRRRNVVGILVAASAAIVVLLAVSIGRISPAVASNEAAKSIPNGDNTLRRYDHLFNMILDWGVTPRSVLEDSSSSPHQALIWLSSEDSLETSNVETIRSRYALATFFYSNKASWKSDTYWMTSYPVCLWHGVECMGNDESVGLVQSLNVTNNGLIGTIPAEIGLLKRHIKTLDLSANSIQGTIPDLSMLENLNKLYLGGNSLSGEISESIYQLSHLTHFYAEDCKLSGKIGGNIGALSNLQGLDLHMNRLSGSIPSSIDQLTDLRAMYLDSNSLDGSIPATIGDMTRLLDLRLRGNHLTGSIPESISKIRLLQILYLDTNQLTGKIPSLADLTLMRELHLYDNAFTGPIPTTIGSLPLLTILYLDQNQLSGGIPTELSGLHYLQDLYLHENHLQGPIPSTLGTFDYLESLRLDSNDLTGMVPSELGSLSRLEHLHLDQNQLIGSVPTTLMRLSRLDTLHLSSNRFVGSIDCDGATKSLTVLEADCFSQALSCSCCTKCHGIE